MNGWLQSGPKSRIVLPILPASADPNLVLPPALSQIVILRNTIGVASLVPNIFLAAGIGSDQFRLFISYRRNDSADLADQLFDRFSHEGFDVFLDRFRGTPGRAFPPQLSGALMDKGLLIVIESPNVWQSQWTIAEVMFAVQFRLGLMSIKTPGGAAFGVIPSTDRFEVSNSDLINSPNGDNLSQSGLNRFVDFVRARYADQLLRRRVFLESLLGNALARYSLQAQWQTNGTHMVSHANGYSVELATRPPNLENVRRAADALTSTSQSAIVTGPRGFLDPQARSNLDWLLDRVNVACFEETTMTQMAQQISNGDQLP
jgi:hypothetical protein